MFYVLYMKIEGLGSWDKKLNLFLFKTALLKFVLPIPASVHNLHVPHGVVLRTKVGSSYLPEHKFLQDSVDISNHICSCHTSEIETTEHYLLLCQNFFLKRQRHVLLTCRNLEIVTITVYVSSLDKSFSVFSLKRDSFLSFNANHFISRIVQFIFFCIRSALTFPYSINLSVVYFYSIFYFSNLKVNRVNRVNG